MALPTIPVPVALGAGGKPKSRGGASARIVALARKELKLGVREVPDGSNRAPAIRRYETATRGAMFGAPWCAYFVSYIARRAEIGRASCRERGENSGGAGSLRKKTSEGV